MESPAVNESHPVVKWLPGSAHKWRPSGLSDALDGTNAFDGAMTQLSNLVPSPNTRGNWVPRPASSQLTAFSGFTGAAQINALAQIGPIAYGMVAETTGANNGKDVPFAYNVVGTAFNSITIPSGAATLPVTPATAGDWTPPTMAAVANRIMITHPGYSTGAGQYIGWLDVSGFSDAGHSGTTHASTTVDALTTNVLLLGWQPGMLISSGSSDFSANTVISNIASGGTSLTISANALTSRANVALTIAGGTPTAPLYGTGNTAVHQLPTQPVAVANFNGRAYYACPSNGAYFSDSLIPTQISSATQAVNPANGLDFTAFGGLPEQQTLGGILQALIAFQGDSQMQQITGDAALSGASALLMNEIGLGVGTLSPNTICQTAYGLAFVAPDGLRIIQFNGTVTDPIGNNGSGVCVPFLNVVNASRSCAAFNQNIIRISVKNGAVNGQPVQEYWYDFGLKAWSGPHTFPAALIDAYQGSPGHGFTLAANGINAKLWESSVTPVSSDTYVENGTQLMWNYQTVLLPDNNEMGMNKMVLATLTAAIGLQQNVNIQALSEQGGVLGTATIVGPNVAAPVWGSVTFGSFIWGGSATYLYQHPLNFPAPIIFKQASLLANGLSVSGTILGNCNLQIEPLNYLTTQTG